MNKKTFLPIAVLTLLAVGGSFTGLVVQQKVHAQAPVTPLQTTVKPLSNTDTQNGKEATVKETSDTTTGVAGSENDGPGGHQDTQGSNIDHQFNGTE